jgi:hypothetical protein
MYFYSHMQFTEQLNAAMTHLDLWLVREGLLSSNIEKVNGRSGNVRGIISLYR